MCWMDRWMSGWMDGWMFVVLCCTEMWYQRPLLTSLMITKRSLLDASYRGRCAIHTLVFPLHRPL